ncbi:aminodeoxychorismate/anthranilate synthase component II [soil metagenome]
MTTGPRVLIVDNYDSFTYNIAQQMGELGADVEVVRHDAFTLDEVRSDRPDGIVISPGPGVPADAGLSNDVIRTFAGDIPLLGVCLGHQCIAEVYGATIVRAPELVHGKTSAIHHDGLGVFAGLPQPFPATRYHSLVADPATIADELAITARTGPDAAHPDLIMGLRHRTLAVEGVKFHPESILTIVGQTLLGNFLHSLPLPASA